jgi:hypothetical protein
MILERYVAASVATVLLSGIAETQPAGREALWQVSEGSPLKDIQGINVLVEDLPEDATKCGLDAESLRSSAARALLDRSIAVGEGVTHPTLYVNIMALRSAANDGCVAALRVELYDYTYFAPRFQQDPRARGGLGLFAPWGGDRAGEKQVRPVQLAPGTVVLMTDGGIFSGPKRGFDVRITTRVRQLVDRFVTKIKLDNDPSVATTP